MGYVLLFLFLPNALIRLNVNDLGSAKLVLDLSRAGFGIYELESFGHRFLLLRYCSKGLRAATSGRKYLVFR